MDSVSEREEDRAGDLTVRSAVLSDVSRVRENHEDNVLLDDRLNTYSRDRCAFRLDARAALIAGVFDGLSSGESGKQKIRPPGHVADHPLTRQRERDCFKTGCHSERSEESFLESL